MKVLVAFEFSGIVRDAFASLGHDAWSCDILPTERPGRHIEGNVFDVDVSEFDLVIAHPPCTYVAVSGNRYYAGTHLRLWGAEVVRRVWNWPVERLCIENPVGVLNKLVQELPKPQYIQPWQFGHGETKKTGLWLRNLPPLQPTDVVDGREARVWRMPPSENRGLERSRTYPGIAKAMAEQWGGTVLDEEMEELL